MGELVAEDFLFACQIADCPEFVIGANGSRECAPDDRLREAIQNPASKNWIAASLRSSQ
jgi:hypothetical protein